MSEALGPGMAAANFSASAGVATAAPSMSAEFGSHAISSSIDISAPTHSYSGASEPSPSLIDKSTFESTPKPFDSLSDNKSIFSNEPAPLIDLSKPIATNIGTQVINSEIIAPDPEAPATFYEAFEDKQTAIEAPSVFQDAFMDNQTNVAVPDVFYQAFADNTPTIDVQSVEPTDEFSIFDTQEAGNAELTPDSILESYVSNPTNESSESEEPAVQAQTATQVLDSIKESNPTAYIEITKDLEIAGNISDLLSNLGISPDEAIEVTQNALKTSLESKGLDQVIEDAQSAEAISTIGNELTSTNPAAEVQASQVQNELDTASEQDAPPPDKQKAYVRDENANNERKSKTRDAIGTVYESRSTQDPVTGEEIIAALNPDPSRNEVSEIVRDQNAKRELEKDGSIPEARTEIGKKTFSSKTEAIEEVERILDAKTAVRRSSNGTVVSEADIARVTQEKIVYQAAA